MTVLACTKFRSVFADTRMELIIKERHYVNY